MSDAVSKRDASVGSKVGLTLAGVVGLRLSSSTPVFLESGLYYTQRGGKEGEQKRLPEIPALVYLRPVGEIGYFIHSGDIL